MSTEPWLQLKIDTTTRDFPDQPVPLIDTLTKWVKLQPDKILFTFLDDKADKVEKELTYKQFDEQSSRMAAYLVDTMKLEQVQLLLLRKE
jgi:acyl-coenzyme A synthetase/AMP-(fatty) acid ligase